MNFIKAFIGFYFNALAAIFPKLAGKQSFYFFCIPFKAKLKPKQQEYLNTAVQNSLLLDGKKIQAYSWGDGPNKILLVHGWQSNTYRWRKYIEEIDLSKHTIIGFDAPGHGNSEGLFCNVPLYEKTLRLVVKHFGVPNSLVSHSIGAFSSMYFMHKNKISIDRFVSLATPFTAVQFVDVFQSELKVSAKLVKYMKSYFKVYTTHPVEYYSLENFTNEIQAKTLIIHDKNDESTGVDNSERLVELMRNAHLEITEGYGHRLKNQKVVNQVCEFVSLN